MRGPGAASESADVCVFGATAGGVLAAVAAADEGASVVLLNQGTHVGGMLSGGLSRTDIERQERLVGGMAREVFRRIGAQYGDAVAWRFEPHVAEQVLIDWLADAGVAVVDEFEIAHADVERHRIRSIASASGAIAEAGAWIDASYEGDLLAAAGASFSIGREGRAVHGERWAGRREMLPNPHQFRAPVSAVDGAGELLHGVVPYGAGTDPAFCTRRGRTPAHDRLPLVAPPGYDRQRFTLLTRYFDALAREGIPANLHDAIGISELPNRKADVNSHGPVSTNLLGGAWAYPTAERAARRAIEHDHRLWAQGLLHFLATDTAVPAVIAEEMVRYGYPADEFIDTGGWPHQLYVREARRLVGEHVLTERDLRDGRVPGDTVGLGGYNIDIREVQWVACPVSRFPDVHDEVLVEGYLSVPVAPYGIPYRSLLPRRTELENLLVSTCISASAVAFASFRMEPKFMIAGHAAGVAAAQAARRNVAVHAVDVDALRGRLELDGQILRPPPPPRPR